MSPALPRALVALSILAFDAIPGVRGSAGAQGVTSATAAPSPTHLEAVAFDAARRRVVLFGGTRQIGGSTWEDLNETWEWDGHRWSSVPTVPGEPGARRAHALAYDPREHRIVLVGGVRTRAGAASDDVYDDSWTFDGARWARGPAIPVMSGHGLVYSAGERTMLLLGYAGREQHDPRRLVIWRRTPNGWTFVDSSGPTLDGLVRAAYDTRRSVLVVPVPHGAASRVWEWDGRRWRSFDAPGPTPRRLHAVAYDDRSGRVVLVGGRENDSRKTLGDAWAWDGQRWTAMPSSADGPDPRAAASLVTDPDSGRLLFYGGTVHGRGMVSELWTWSGLTWTQWRPSGVNRQGAAPAFTSARGAFVGISVSDIEASVRWYTEKLGLTVVMRPPKIEKSTAVILEGGNVIVELMHHDDAVPLGTAAPSITRNYLVTGIFKAGIIVDDFDKAIAELRARGVPIAIGPFPATAEQRANAIIRDNEGNYLQLFGAR